MTDNTFKIEFQILAPDRMRVFLNDRAVGYLRIHEFSTSGIRKTRMSYRASSSPYKCLIQTPDYRDLTNETVESMLTDSHVYRRVVAAVIRSDLHNYTIVEIPMRAAA